MQDLQRLSPSGWVCARGRLLRVSKPIPESKFHVETPPIRQIPFVRPILEFTKLQASSGILLITVALIAMAWANSPLSEQYFHLWKRPLVVGFDTYVFSMSFHDVISDGLMAIFFLLVGLEIKREFVMGELSTVRRAALPLMAAAGGMVVPALIYLIFNKGLPTEGGWGIAVATDIAFTLGVITLLGNRVPLALKVFLTAFAIADDIGAVIIIALVYSNDLNLNALAAMGAICLLLALLNIGGVRSLVPYLVLGVFLWQATYFSGIHATVSGVLLAFFIPMNFRMRTKQFLGLVRRQLNRIERENPSDDAPVTERRHYLLGEVERAAESASMPLIRLEHALHPWVSYAIMPLFALANAGVALSGMGFEALAHPVFLGGAFGLAAGKGIGISLFSWLAVRLGFADLPRNVTWRQLVGAGILGGIGFTMSLFIANLGLSPEDLPEAKLGVLTASSVAGTVGLAWLHWASRRRTTSK
ncbi:MAG: Na+/H+ antiporter NhaA [Armatimonadota bacterium]